MVRSCYVLQQHRMKLLHKNDCKKQTTSARLHKKLHLWFLCVRCFKVNQTNTTMSEKYDVAVLENAYERAGIHSNNSKRSDVLLHQLFFDRGHLPNMVLEMTIQDRALEPGSPVNVAKRIVKGYAKMHESDPNCCALRIHEQSFNGWRQLSQAEIEEYLVNCLVNTRNEILLHEQTSMLRQSILDNIEIFEAIVAATVDVPPEGLENENLSQGDTSFGEL